MGSIRMRKAIMDTMNNRVRMRMVNKDDGRWETKCCMCGSVPNHWELIDGHGRNSERWGEEDKIEHKSSHYDDKDTDRWNEDYKKKYKGSHHDDKDTERWNEDYKKKYKGSHH